MSGSITQADLDRMNRLKVDANGTYAVDKAAYQSPSLQQSYDATKAMAASRFGYANNGPYGTVSASPMGQTVQTGSLGAAQQGQAAYGPNGLSVQGGTLDPQAQLFQAMQARASGSLNTDAQQQLRTGSQDGLRQQMAVASTMQNGANAGLLRRQFAQGAADTTQNTAQASAILRAQEMAQGQQQMQQYLGQARGMDIGQAQNTAALQGQNAQMFNDMSQYNAGQQNAYVMQQGDMDRQRMLTQAQMDNAAQGRAQTANLANQRNDLNTMQQQQARTLAGLGMQGDIAANQLQSSTAYDQARQNAQMDFTARAQGLDNSTRQLGVNLAGAGISAFGNATSMGIKNS